MNTFVNTFLLVYAALFPIVNPFGSAPFFLSLTDQYTNIERARIARQIAINSFLLLLGSLLIGSHVLGFFGVSLPIVRVAGGLVVTAFGWKLLNSPAQAEHEHDAQQAAAHDDPDTFYPLTMPLTVGPGSISVAVTIGSQRATSDWQQFVVESGRRGRESRRDGADRVSLLPVRAAACVGARARRHECCRAAVCIHSVVHRHPDSVERCQGACSSRLSGVAGSVSSPTTP